MRVEKGLDSAKPGTDCEETVVAGEETVEGSGIDGVD